MTPFGHTLTGFGLAAVGGLWVSDGAMLSWEEWLNTGPWFAAPDTLLPATMAGAAFAAGAALGGRAPDRLEVPWVDRFDQRRSLIPHRTLTHWPPLWLVALAGAYWVVTASIGWPTLLGWLLLGYVGSGLLHLAIDAGSGSGIPLFTPFGRRYSYHLYRTGSIRELGLLSVLLGAFALIGGVIQWWH